MKKQILRDFARMFSICGMNMITVRCWWSEPEKVVSEGVDATSVLPNPADLSVFGLVFSTFFDTLES